MSIILATRLFEIAPAEEEILSLPVDVVKVLHTVSRMVSAEVERPLEPQPAIQRPAPKVALPPAVTTVRAEDLVPIKTQLIGQNLVHAQLDRPMVLDTTLRIVVPALMSGGS